MKYWNLEEWPKGMETALVGEMHCTFKDIKEKFGPSNNWDSYKSDAEWRVMFEDGTFATIYNYKDGVNYNGRADGTPKTKITEWHIGGETERARELVFAVIGINSHFHRVTGLATTDRIDSKSAANPLQGGVK